MCSKYGMYMFPHRMDEMMHQMIREFSLLVRVKCWCETIAFCHEWTFSMWTLKLYFTIVVNAPEYFNLNIHALKFTESGRVLWYVHHWNYWLKQSNTHTHTHTIIQEICIAYLFFFIPIQFNWMVQLSK